MHGDLLYTQEQRGDDEIVSCYKVSTGEPVWRHRDAVRFYESNGGAGPRGTPTLSHGRVYTLGATGILNALDAGNGAVVWSRNAASDTGRKIPEWGIASSPLVVDDIVVVAVSGTLAAYDLATGKPRWVGPQHGGSYSSPQLVTIDGVAQILLLSAPGAVSVAPADGTLLWEYSWEGGAIVQPAFTADGGVLINAMSMMGGMATRRLAVAHGAGGWTAEERWTSNGLKPYYNDFVVHKGHAFGFDGNILACIDLEDGKRKWKGGRYGNGQLVLLADQDLLLVLSEDGELALVAATPDKFTELARVPGAQWQDLEPPGAGRRRPAGSQRRGDGRVPAVPRGSRPRHQESASSASRASSTARSRRAGEVETHAVVALVAGHLEERTPGAIHRLLDRPGSGEDGGIVDRRLIGQGVRVRALEAFHDAEILVALSPWNPT